MQTAEHAVNRASIGFIHVWDADDTGSMKMNAPNRIAPKKPSTISHRFFMPAHRPSSSKNVRRCTSP